MRLPLSSLIITAFCLLCGAEAFAGDLDLNQAADLSMAEDSAKEARLQAYLQQRHYCFGFSISFPYLVGVRYERFLKTLEDHTPNCLLTVDLGLTPLPGCVVLGASAQVERRLGNSAVYLGGGYAFTGLAFGVSGGDVGAGGLYALHSLCLSISTRSSYQDHFIFNISLSGLVTPALTSWEVPVLPVIRLSLVN